MSSTRFLLLYLEVRELHSRHRGWSSYIKTTKLAVWWNLTTKRMEWDEMHLLTTTLFNLWAPSESALPEPSQKPSKVQKRNLVQVMAAAWIIDHWCLSITANGDRARIGAMSGILSITRSSPNDKTRVADRVSTSWCCSSWRLSFLPLWWHHHPSPNIRFRSAAGAPIK